MRSGCKASNNNHSNRDGCCCGPHRCGTGDELGASQRQYHRLFQHGRRNGRKSVELFRDMLPSIGRVAALANPADPFTAPFLEQIRLAGRTAGIRIEPVAMARGPEEAEAAFATISQEGAEAVVVQGIFFSKTIAELALKYRLPTASVLRQFAEVGGLISYGADTRDIYRRSATLVHKILQGTNPSDLPVELPTRFELVLNMKTAKALGIDVPWFFQQRADEVIE
jgi:ABC-type uncharacterized transport system substrate-binding protein